MKALTQNDEGPRLSIAPLIDVVFLLLIFFLVATTFYEEEKDITIRLAEATEGTDREAITDLVVVNIKESGIIIVKERVQTLGQLEDLLASAKKNNPRVSAIVRCDRHAPHMYFVRVLNLCEKLGITGVSVATFQIED